MTKFKEDFSVNKLVISDVPDFKLGSETHNTLATLRPLFVTLGGEVVTSSVGGGIGEGAPAAGVLTFNGRYGIVLPTAGDYTTALVTEIIDKRYQTDSQKLHNDATSSIQTQLNNKAERTELAPLATKDELTTKADASALALKADKTELEPLATKDEVALKANKADTINISGSQTKWGDLTLEDYLCLPNIPLDVSLNTKRVGISTITKNLVELGEDEDLEVYATNKTTALIPKGSVVYLNGAQGGRPTIALALADSSTVTSLVFGVVKVDIPVNSSGYVVTHGLALDLNTSMFIEGDRVYLSDTIPGGLTTTVPVSPNHRAIVGTITRVHGVQGSMVVGIRNAVKLGEVSDVLLANIVDRDVMTYDAATSLWKNIAIGAFAARLGVPTSFSQLIGKSVHGVPRDLGMSYGKSFEFKVSSPAGSGDLTKRQAFFQLHELDTCDFTSYSIQQLGRPYFNSGKNKTTWTVLVKRLGGTHSDDSWSSETLNVNWLLI